MNGAYLIAAMHSEHDATHGHPLGDEIEGWCVLCKVWRVAREAQDAADDEAVASATVGKWQ